MGRTARAPVEAVLFLDVGAQQEVFSSLRSLSSTARFSVEYFVDIRGFGKVVVAPRFIASTAVSIEP